MNPTIGFCRTFKGCVPRLRRLSFFCPSVPSKSFCCCACIFSIMSSLLLHPLIHCTTDVTPACDAAVNFLTLFAIAFLWLLMNVAIVCVVELSKILRYLHGTIPYQPVELYLSVYLVFLHLYLALFFLWSLVVL
jgi:hypothetical protein